MKNNPIHFTMFFAVLLSSCGNTQNSNSITDIFKSSSFKDLPRQDFQSKSGTFKDTRDDHVYKWVRIGEQVWMAQNLAYMPFLESGIWVYDYYGLNKSEAKSSGNYFKYGCLYDWETATSDDFGNGQDICPTGWHLPSDQDWVILEMYLGMSQSDADKSGILTDRNSGSVGTKLKSTIGWDDNGKNDNSSGFTALPGGSRTDDDGFFSSEVEFSGLDGGLLGTAGFWTASETDRYFAVTRTMDLLTDPGVRRSKCLKSSGNSVRCVKN